MKKKIRNPKPEIRIKIPISNDQLLYSTFVIRILTFIRHSSFGFRHLLLVIVLLIPLFSRGEAITLDKAIEGALEYNEGILTARDKVRETEIGVMIARAGFLPKISGQASYTRLAEIPTMKMEIPIPGFETSEFKMGEEENYLARVSLSQPLFTWGKILTGYQIAKLNVSMSKEDFRKQKNELIFTVTKSFYGILVLEEFVKLTEDAYTQTERHLEVVEKRYYAGVTSKFDLLRSRVQLKNMEPNLIKVNNTLDLAKTGFKTLLGLPQDTTIKLEGELKYETINIDLDQSIKEAQSNRPEIKTLLLTKKIAGKAVSITKKSNLPNLAFIANYDYKKPLYFENEWGTDWNVILALQMPIFTGFENLGKIRQAKCQLSQVEHGLNLLKDGIELEVRAVYLQLEEAKKLVESQKENITQAEEALSIVEERYKQGLATSLEVMDTQLAVTQAKTNWLQSLSDYLIAKAKLEKAIGG